MTHLGQSLSALIDGELDGGERERVLVHMGRCGSCRDEVAALRLLKRRMNALGDAAAGSAVSGLTGRLLDELGRMPGWPEAGAGDRQWPGEASRAWPRDEAGGDRGRHGPGSGPARYVVAGSLAVVLAGLGTAAFLAGGDSAPQAPSRPVAPAVDVFGVPRGPAGPGPAPLGARSAGPSAFPAPRRSR